MYIYGKNPVREALNQSKHPVKRVFVLRGRNLGDELCLSKFNVKVTEVPERVLRDLVGNQHHQGVVAEIEFVYAAVETFFDYSRVLLLDHIQDPHNLGALGRSAAAFGIKGIVIPQDRAVHVTPAVVKVSEGNVFKVEIAIVTNLRRTIEAFKERGFWIYGADAGGKPVWDIEFDGKIALVLGNEGKGLSRLVREGCDELIAVPMEPGVESLNVSVSGAILMYELYRRSSRGCEDDPRQPGSKDESQQSGGSH